MSNSSLLFYWIFSWNFHKNFFFFKYYPQFFSGAFMALYITLISLMYLEFILAYMVWRASKVSLVVKNLPANAEDKRDAGSIPGSGRSPGVGNGNPLQYSCLGNPTGRGDWCAIVFGVTKNWACLSDWAHLVSGYNLPLFFPMSMKWLVFHQFIKIFKIHNLNRSRMFSKFVLCVSTTDSFH